MTLLVLASAALWMGQLVPGGKSEAVEAEVRRNLLEQPVGPVTVAAFGVIASPIR